LAELSGVAENKVRRGIKQVELPDDITAGELEDKLKSTINETLDGEWVFAIESVMFVEHAQRANTVCHATCIQTRRPAHIGAAV
jgi:hypothetical protein